MSSPSSSTWPVGYPCRVVTDVQASPGFMAVSVGTQAKVVRANTVNGQDQACIELPTVGGYTGRVGWVPRSALDIGNVRRVGEIGFSIGRPPDPSFPASFPLQGGLTFTTIKNLILSYYNNRMSLPIEPVFVRDRLNNTARQGFFANRICHGIDRVNRGIRVLLDNGNWDWKDVRNLCPDGRNLKTGVGIYLIVHENFLDGNGLVTTRLPEMYTGSTSENFQARHGKHAGVEGWGATAPTSPHYRIAAKAQNHSYFPICYFDSDDIEKSDLKIAEQVFQDLFQTTCTAVLNLESFSETNEDTDASADAARREMRAPEAQARAVKYLEDKEAATVMARNSDNVFAATGWPGGVRRAVSANRKPFGIAAGLNWSMPITEMRFEKQTWIMSRIPGRYANYHRVAYISREDSRRQQGRKVIWQKNTVGRGDSNVAFYLPQNEPGPDHGTKVHVVVEIRLDDQPCGVPWSRMPTVGPWSDWLDATKVAMRIEWEDENGNWFFKHLMADYPNNFAKDANRNDIIGASTGYRVATGLKAYFLRQDRPQSATFPWLYDFGIAEVKEIYFDHLTQNICTRRINERTTAPLVRALSEQEIAQQLLDAGAERYAHRADPNAVEIQKGDTGFPVDSGSVGITQWNDTSKYKARTSCDYCSSMVKAGGRSANQVSCKEVGSTRRCTQCTAHGKPCTFTRESILLDPDNDTLLRATYNPKKIHTNIQPLEVGRFVHTF